jgi:hypothetical protein
MEFLGQGGPNKTICKAMGLGRGSGSRNTENTGKYRSSGSRNTENVQYRNFNTIEYRKNINTEFQYYRKFWDFPKIPEY